MCGSLTKSGERSSHRWDLVIKDALVFDGTGSRPEYVDVGVCDGKVTAMDAGLPAESACMIDGRGKWVLPGLLDIHTHLDLELEIDPRLTEVVRHGTTSVVVGNCSLGLALGHLPYGTASHSGNAVVDCFARVETIPARVLSRAFDTPPTWSDPVGYLSHLSEIRLGPNVSPLLPHSMLRVAVLGMPDAVRRSATPDEIRTMQHIVDLAMGAGYPGLSTDKLSLHYLASEQYQNDRIPSQRASLRELRALFEVVRAHRGIVQFTPDSDDKLTSFRMMLLSSGRLYGSPLRMTVTAILDMATNPHAKDGLLLFARALNSRVLRGHLRLQALAAPFLVSADGTLSPLMEERAAFRELSCLDVEDVATRRELLQDPQFLDRFREDWWAGRRGGWIRRIAQRFEASTFSRELRDMRIEACPVKVWEGERFSDLYSRLRTWQTTGGLTGARDEEEGRLFAGFPTTADEAEFVLHLLRLFDRDLRWQTTAANGRPHVVKQLLFSRDTIPGFSDSGAHLTNLAYFDNNLRFLRVAAADGIDAVAKAVARVTSEPADLFGLDAGRIAVGQRADLVVIDPRGLERWNPDTSTVMIDRPQLGHRQLVNRSDGVVHTVVIGGHVVWDQSEFVPDFKRRKTGRLLLAQSGNAER